MTVSRRDRILLAALAALALLAGVWWFVVRPAGAEASAARDELALVRSDIGGIRDTIARLEANPVSESERTAERLRLAEALPERADIPGAILQLHRLADQANVELTAVRANAVQDYGTVRSTELELQVTGRFFEADDFLYRMHRLVVVGDDGRPAVSGRLFATTAIDINLAEGGVGVTGLGDTDPVVATIRVRAFSADGGAAGAAGTPDVPGAAGTAGTP